MITKQYPDPDNTSKEITARQYAQRKNLTEATARKHLTRLTNGEEVSRKRGRSAGFIDPETGKAVSIKAYSRKRGINTYQALLELVSGNVTQA